MNTPTLPAARIESEELLDLLASLVQKSLAVYEEDEEGQGRYRLLETVRQYARDRLLEAKESDGVRDRHLDFLLALAEEAEPELWRDAAAVERLESEHDNLRAALEWSAGHSPETSLRLAGSLHWFWHIRGHFTEGRGRLETALTGSPNAGAAVRRKALYGAAQIAGSMGDHEQARAWGEESLALCQAAGDRAGIAWSLLAVAGGVFKPGASVRTPGAEEALSLFREIDDKPGTALALYMSALGPKDEQRIALLEECLTLCRSMGYRWLSSYVLEGLGWNAHGCSRMERARAFFEESLAIRREYGDRAAIAHTLNGLLGVARHMGDARRASEVIEEALGLARECGNKPISFYVILGGGHHFLGRGEYERAEALFEEALVLSRELGQLTLQALVNLARAAQVQGNHEKAGPLFAEARALCEEDLASRRERRDPSLLFDLAGVARDQGEYQEARQLLEEALAIFREQRSTHFIARSLTSLGRVASVLGDYEAAQAFLEEGLPLWRELGNQPRTVTALEGLAAVAAAQAQPERAARLFGAAERFREAILFPPLPADRAEHDRSVGGVRTALGDEAFAAVWAEGQALSLEDAIQLALEETEPS